MASEKAPTFTCKGVVNGQNVDFSLANAMSTGRYTMLNFVTEHSLSDDLATLVSKLDKFRAANCQVVVIEIGGCVDKLVTQSTAATDLFILADNDSSVAKQFKLENSGKSMSGVFIVNPSGAVCLSLRMDCNYVLSGDEGLRMLKGVQAKENTPSSPVAVVDPKHRKIWYAPNRFEAYGDEEIQAVNECLKDGWLAPGPRTEEFAHVIAEYFGKKHGVMVNSGSSANMLALCVCGIGPGDEIVTPACTFSTTVAPICQLGATPVFCDVLAGRYVPSVEQIMAVVTPKTKALFIPNLIGGKPDWEELRRRLPNMLLIEDSCDTMTYTPCTDIAVCSFYASHIITAGGCGGVVMYNDEELKKKALMYRDWGRIGTNSEDVSERFCHEVDGIEYDFKFLYGVRGYNFKCSEMNAAFGLAQMKKYPRFRQMRRDNIDHYCTKLKGTRYILPCEHNNYDWLAMPFMHPQRKQILPFLEENNVQTRVCFAGNITRHPVYREYLGDFPVSDQIMREGFLLGAHHGLSSADIDRVCDLLIEADKKFL